MKKLFGLILTILFFGVAQFQVLATYSSLFVFGDALCTTTNNPTGGSSYFGKRYTNGRVWVEVLAQRQGIGISNNWSYFDCNSSNLVTNVGNFTPPPNASNALFIVWVNNSDLYDVALDHNTNLTTWTTAINRSQTNYFRAITNLYAKGMRTLVTPNAVDISKVPFFAADSSTNFMRQRSIAYNTNFINTLNAARTACPNLKIYSPDFFSLLNNVVTNAGIYGLTNYTANGLSVDALNSVNYAPFISANTNGRGTNFIYWDDLDPTAKFHAVIADETQEFISPTLVTNMTIVTGGCQMSVMNVPVGLNGIVEGVQELLQTNWTAQASFSSTNANQNIFVSGTGPQWFYRLRFPYAWSWP